jgi:glycosyltransferase involved in cell wall biosynthesis
MSERAPVTAIIASRNEAGLLEQRLPELRFCDEVIVIDIDSQDETAAVALAAGARLVRHDWVPIAELARLEVAPTARNDWLLFVDPDEEIPSALAAQVASFLRDPPPDVAVVFAGIDYLFAGRALRGTYWGGTGRRPFLVRRGGVVLSSAVHETLSFRPGFRGLHLELDADNVIRHHWVQGYREWIEKHRRYLKLEGASQADRGLITGPRAIAGAPWRGFRDSFFARGGYRDGVRGLVLSALWAWYVAASEIALYRELRRRAT